MVYCIFFFLYTMSLHGALEFQLIQYTTADGLPNNTVRKILQDSRGRLWVATSNGVSRFDGTHFVNYRVSHESGRLGLADQRVSNMYEDMEQRLWILSPLGEASCIDLHTDCLIDYKARHIEMPADPSPFDKTRAVDRWGRVWSVSSTDGLFVASPSAGVQEHFTTQSPTNQLPTDALKCIYIDSDGVVWLGTDNLGLSRLRVIQNDGVEYRLQGENIRMLTSLADGSVAVGSRSGWVWIYDSAMNECIDSVHRDHNTYCMMQDAAGVVWHGTKGEGLYVGSTHYLHLDSVPESVAHNDIYSLFTDFSGNCWVGTFGGGLCRAVAVEPAGTYRFIPYLNGDYGSRRVRCVAETADSLMWVATSNGVYVFDVPTFLADTTACHHLSLSGRQLMSNEVRTLYAASDGSVYISEAGEGFAIFTSDAGRRPVVVHRVSELTDSLVNSMVQCFVEDLDGMVWVSTEFGVSRYNPYTRRLTNYFFSKNMLTNVYSENCGCRLADGRLAFGTNNGVVLIDPQVYNAGERSQLSRSDVTIDGQSPRHDIIYIMRQWWNSPWAVAIYIVVVVAVLVWWLRVRRNNHRYNRLVHTLKTQRESIREQFSTDVALRRKANLDAADSEFVSRIDAIVANHIADSQFTPDHFAAEMGMGRTTFYNNMRRITGYAPREYITRKRIKMAAHLITTTTHTIAEISDRVGIEDPLYLSRLFRKIYGCSPREWRKNAGKHTQPDATISSQPFDDILNGR